MASLPSLWMSFQPYTYTTCPINLSSYSIYSPFYVESRVTIHITENISRIKSSRSTTQSATRERRFIPIIECFLRYRVKVRSVFVKYLIIRTRHPMKYHSTECIVRIYPNCLYIRCGVYQQGWSCSICMKETETERKIQPKSTSLCMRNTNERGCNAFMACYCIPVFRNVARTNGR